MAIEKANTYNGIGFKRMLAETLKIKTPDTQPGTGKCFGWLRLYTNGYSNWTRAKKGNR
ncbi:MAG: hypothetical protein KF829_01090 [Ferruginibacter sp.]|nr:hypothetical protein [Ferruginibacter sp.]